MAIRKISDLPIIEPNEYDSDKILYSYMELSYEKEPGKYISKKVTPETLLSSVAEEIRKADNTFTGNNEFNAYTKFINNGPAVEISGGFYVNKGIDPNNSNYNSIQNYYELSVRTSNKFTLNVSDKSKVTGDNNGIDVTGNITLEKGKIRTEASEGTDIVNLNKLSSYVKQKIDELLAGQTEQYLFEFPYLTFVYSDHVIESTNWILAGSTIDLSEYPTLSAWLMNNNSKNLNSLRRSPSTNQQEDKFYFKYDESANTLTLPQTDWFIQGNLDNITPTFKTQQLTLQTLTNCSVPNMAPNTVGISIGSYGLTCATRNGFNCVGVKSDGIYTKNADVQPYATKLLMYFYVGKKG